MLILLTGLTEFSIREQTNCEVWAGAHLMKGGWSTSHSHCHGQPLPRPSGSTDFLEALPLSSSTGLPSRSVFVWHDSSSWAELPLSTLEICLKLRTPPFTGFGRQRRRKRGRERMKVNWKHTIVGDIGEPYPPSCEREKAVRVDLEWKWLGAPSPRYGERLLGQNLLIC